MRIPVSGGMLAAYVEEELQVRTMGGERFTAYDITKALRRRHPGVEIPHSPVRTVVHAYMSNLLAVGQYQASLCHFGARTAIMYEPAPLDGADDSADDPANRAGIPGLPLLPFN